MQITDLVSQYNNNFATGKEISTKAQGVEQLVSTVQKLAQGQVFEGTVNAIKGNNVILGLSSGQNITATLTRDIMLEQGQSVFFQVKSNDGQTIQIKPISNNAMNNPTLLNALDSANLTVNERNVNMVNNMMREQMPIDANSLNHMARIVNSNSGIDVATIIQMSKAGIEITPQLAAQYENYKANQSSVMNMISELSQSIPDMLSSSELDYSEAVALNKEIVDILSDDAVSNLDSSNIAEEISLSATDKEGELIYKVDNNQPNTSYNVNAGETLKAANTTASNSALDIATGNKSDIDSFINQVNNNTSDTQPIKGALQASNEAASISEDVPINITSYDKSSFPVHTIGHTLTEEQYKALNDIIKNDTDFLKNNSKLIDSNGNLDTKANVSEFMKSFAEYINNVDVSKKVVRNLFSSDGYKSLINDMTSQQWTIDPKDVEQKDIIKKLYEKLEDNMNRIEQATASIDKAGSQITKATQDIRSNIDFMNQVNQNFSYVQLPIRLSNQNTNTELFVYKNKMNKSDDDEISAFLHFDMDHLGSTDISVKLHNKNVDTKFYMEDDRSYELVMNNIEILQKRIEAKGFNCNINVENESNKKNLVDDFLSHNSKGSTTPLSRYSFDVRA